MSNKKINIDDLLTVPAWCFLIGLLYLSEHWSDFI